MDHRKQKWHKFSFAKNISILNKSLVKYETHTYAKNN